MFIQYAEFHGYKRFMLNSVKTFRLTMTEIVQIILGTNGSGKSSLVEELTPLPATKDKFIKGGYKIIVIHHNGDNYRLESRFSNGQEHFLIKNEVEDLNPGNTLTVQKEQVKKIFGITPELHALAIGEEQFTSMAPNRRREWLTKLNDADYNYSISVYKKVTERLRDTVGTLRSLRRRYADEMSRKFDEETIKEINRKLSELTMSSRSLYALKNLEVGKSDTLGFEVERNSQIIRDLDKQFRTLRKEFRKDDAYSHGEINDIIDELSSQLSVIEGNYSQLSQSHMTLMDKLSSVRAAEGLNIPTLIREIEELKRDADVIRERCFRNITYSNWDQSLRALNDCYEVLVSVFTTLDPDPEKVINRENYDKLVKEVDVGK